MMFISGVVEIIVFTLLMAPMHAAFVSDDIILPADGTVSLH